MNYIVSKIGEDKMLNIMESKCRVLAAIIKSRYNQQNCNDDNSITLRLMGEIQAIIDVMEEYDCKEIYKGKYDFKDYLIGLAKK